MMARTGAPEAPQSSAVELSVVDLRLPPLRHVGYVRGASDRVPEALLATREIADRCNVGFTFGKYQIPRFPVADGVTVIANVNLVTQTPTGDGHTSWTYDEKAPMAS